MNFTWTTLRDARYGFRRLKARPSFTVIAILTLTIGIGANTAIFSVIEATLLRPLPYRDPRCVVLLKDVQNPEDGGFLYSDMQILGSRSGSFENIAWFYRNSGLSQATLTIGDDVELTQGAFVSASFFPLMGVSPLIGRTFTSEEEERRERVVLLSYNLWVRSFGEAKDVTTQVLRVNGVNAKIIGVMPAAFQFPARNQQFWAPITTNPGWGDPALLVPNSGHNRFFFERWQAVARLRRGVSLSEAQSEINTLFSRLTNSDPDENRGLGVRVVPLTVNVSGDIRLAFAILAGAVVFVLLIACANVASLILAEGAAREREMAIRLVLGAGQRGILRQMLTESIILGLISGSLGVLLASIGMNAMVALKASDIPRLEQAGLDMRVLIFTFVLSLFAAVIFGLVPALRFSRTNLNESLKSAAGSSGAPSPTRTFSLLVIVQFMLAVILLTGGGLLIRSLLAIEAVDLGFRPENVITLKVTLSADAPQGQKSVMYSDILERINTLPGVEAAGAIDNLFDFDPPTKKALRIVAGRAPEPKENLAALTWQTIRGDYFRTMGISLLEGRYFSEQDSAQSGLVAIIDANVARRYWQSDEPLGKQFKGQDSRGATDEWLTVIGVVRNVRNHGPDRQPTGHIYQWYKQVADADAVTPDLVVRTTDNPAPLAVSVREAIRDVNHRVIISPAITMKTELTRQLAPRIFYTSVLSMFSFIAVVLACGGIFGIMQYSVSRRTREIGIRIAIGAQRPRIILLVIVHSMKLAFVGISFGVAGAWALTRLMSSLLFEVRSSDPITMVGVVLLLMFLALAAGYGPVRRAMQIDPLVSIRYE